MTIPTVSLFWAIQDMKGCLGHAKFYELVMSCLILCLIFLWLQLKCPYMPCTFLQAQNDYAYLVYTQVKHYEEICAGVENNIASQHKYDQELKNLRMDIQHWKV